MSDAAPAPGLGRRLAGNAFHASIGRATALLLWMAVTPTLFHGLSREAFAVWSLFFALTGYLNSLDLGLAQVTLRHAASGRARGNHAEAGEFATIAALGYLALAVVFLAVVPFAGGPLVAFLRVPAGLAPEARFALLMGPLVFLCAGLSNVTLAVSQGYGRFDLANLIAIASGAGQALGSVLALRLGHGLHGVLVAIVCGWLAGFVVGLLVVVWAAPGFRWASPAAALRRTREALAFGGPVQVGNVIAVIHQQLDKLLLPRFASLALVAPYELGLRVSNAAAIVPYLMLGALLPEASALHARGEHARLREMFQRAGRYVFVATAAMTAALMASADLLLAAWLGGPQPEAALALRGLVLALALALMTGPTSSVARGAGLTRPEPEYSLIALATHVALGVLLVPRFGLAGALTALVAGNLLGGLWYMSRCLGVLGWPRLGSLAEPFGVPLLSGIGGALAGTWLARALPASSGATAWLSAGLVGALGAAAALLVAFAFRYVNWREARALMPGGR